MKLKSTVQHIFGMFMGSRQSNRSDHNDHLIDITALLIRIATIDREISRARRMQLQSILKRSYDLDEITLSRIVAEAESTAQTAIDLYRFTQPLNQGLNNEDCCRIVRLMWELVYADRQVTELEQNIIWRAADLLSVSTRQRVELRREVLAAMDSCDRGQDLRSLRPAPLS